MNDAVALHQNPPAATAFGASPGIVISPRLAGLWKRGTDFLGCPLAIISGAMT